MTLFGSSSTPDSSSRRQLSWQSQTEARVRSLPGPGPRELLNEENDLIMLRLMTRGILKSISTVFLCFCPIQRAVSSLLDRFLLHYFSSLPRPMNTERQHEGEERKGRRRREWVGVRQKNDKGHWTKVWPTVWKLKLINMLLTEKVFTQAVGI